MEVYHTEDHYILHDGDFSLWCDRARGTLEPKKGLDLCSAWNPVCIGCVYGVIGKLIIHPDMDPRLILIRKRSLVGKINGEHEVYKIDKVTVLPLSSAEPVDLDLGLCKLHHFGMKRTQRITQQAEGKQQALQKTWKTIKSAAENVKPKKKELKERDKFVKRIVDEVLKMYNDSDSFYYCETYDLSNSVERQHQDKYDRSVPMWKRTDPRFFWNSHLVTELVNMQASEEEVELASHWITPIIQGYFQLEKCTMEFTDLGSSPADQMALPDFGNTKNKGPLNFNLGIISRRSIHRAGTRSKKRGLEESGACANYVETEQILEFSCHTVSFVQVRGSIPAYWSQTGFKYRPPPKLDRDDQETYTAFKAHFDEQLSLYRSIVAINLAELCGKEKAISDAYLKHLLTYNSPDITYVMFDFHEYCRGMKFENVSILTDGINDIIKRMRYCWVDRKGMICEQRGVFRENCVDCLDRTNVVQTAIARIVMETQCRKLGILAPEENLPQSCKLTFQQLWANNGDVISRQYAGTVALKGDFTRTGERKFSGMMKDGMNSANRYYLRFKDSYRQASIDLMLGRPVTMEEFLMLGNTTPEEEEDVAELMEKEQNLKLLVEDCKEMLIVEPEQCLGGWSLINADPVCGDPDRSDMDMILLLSQRAVYVAWYDDEEEQLVQYQRIFLEDIERIEIGLEPSIFKSKFVCMRLHYTNFAEDGFFHTFRTPRTRLFNNMVIAVRNLEESRESLKAIHQAFAAARQIFSLDLEAVDRQKLDRKKTKPHPDVQDIHKQQQENALTGIHIPRDISSPDLTYKHKGLVSPDIQRRRLSPNSPSTSGATSPSSSPGRPRHNILPNFADVKKSFNSGIKLNFNVPKFSLQNVNLSKRFGGSKSKEDVVDGSNNSITTTTEENLEKKSKLVKERTYSQDDSTVGTATSSFDETMQAEDDNIVLDSCGIITKGRLGSSLDETTTGSTECLKETLKGIDSIKLQQDNDVQTDKKTNVEEHLEEEILHKTDAVESSEGDILHKMEEAEGDDDAFLVIEENDVEKLLAGSSKPVPKIQADESASNIKVPKIVTSAAKTRKLQRIMETLQEDISDMLEGKTCLTQIIIV